MSASTLVPPLLARILRKPEKCGCLRIRRSFAEGAIPSGGATNPHPVRSVAGSAGPARTVGRNPGQGIRACRFGTFGLALLTWVRAAAPIPFPQSQSDLAPDPAAVFGTLPNGLRYVIRPNHEPRNRISLRLLVEAGSLEEKPNQRGLAHFLEHMAFNGSAHFAPGTLVELLQRMGMGFGADTNASTGFDRTQFLLELPNAKEETLAQNLRVFADYADTLLLRPQDINKERGIILSEKRARDSVGYRTAVAELGFLLHGSRFPDRWPIGLSSVVEHAQRDRFVDFYDTWYRPELLSVIVVGDIDPVKARTLVERTFSPIAARAPARPPPGLGSLDLARATGVHVFHHVEAEAPDTTVSIRTIESYHHEPDTAARRREYLPRTLANSILDHRLAILAKKSGAPFVEGSADAGEAFNFYRESSISLTCRANQWSAALGTADHELRRALRFGFEEPELRQVVAEYRNSLEQAARSASTRHSDAIADEIADDLNDREVFTSPAQDLALLGPALDRITAADCLAALRKAWRAPHRLVLVTGNAKIPGGDLAAIRRVYDKAHAEAVAAPPPLTESAWSYTRFGPPGRVLRRQDITDLGITLVTFANGVRLNLKQTAFEASRIRLNLRVGNGQLTEPHDKPGLAFYTGETFVAGGLGKYSYDELQRILAGHTVGASFGAGGDAFVSTGVTNRTDLLLQLQLMTAMIVDPGYRPEAARQAAKAIRQLYLSLEHTPSGPFTLEVARLLARGDPRFGLPPERVMLQRSLNEERTWLTPDLQRGYIELAVVGDFDVKATIRDVAETLGALPRRDPRVLLEPLRLVQYPSSPISRSYAIPTEIRKGVVAIYWPTTDQLKIHLARRLGLLGAVLSDRLRVTVREHLGETYSPGAGNNPSDVYPGYGFMVAHVTVAPPQAEQVADIVTGVAAKLAANGVTPDELRRAKEPILTELRESARTNQYWIDDVLARAQERPQVLDWCRSRYSDISSITTADLDAVARRYLPSDRASRIIVIPQREPESH